jgi:hypothetical protein
MKNEAMIWLAKLFDRGISTQEWIAHDPDFDSLRDDPQFQALLARLT